MDSDDLQVTMAKIGKPHGIKGWLRIHSYTDPDTNIGNYRNFRIKTDASHIELEMDQLKRQGNNLIAHFKGFDQPEKAQELVGMELQVGNTQLPDLENGEYYWHQLQGLSVINLEGQYLGVVEKLMETGANDVLVVRPDENSIDQVERLIPYLPDSVIKDINLNEAKIKVDWESDYLL